MDFDPYEAWLGIPADCRPPSYYDLLGLDHFESDPGTIEQAALRRMAKVRPYQLGPYSEQSQQVLSELARARLVLMDPDRRVDYDANLRASDLGLKMAVGFTGHAEHHAPNPVHQASSNVVPDFLQALSQVTTREESSPRGRTAVKHSRPVWTRRFVNGFFLSLNAGVLCFFPYWGPRASEVCWRVYRAVRNEFMSPNVSPAPKVIPPPAPPRPREGVVPAPVGRRAADTKPAESGKGARPGGENARPGRSDGPVTGPDAITARLEKAKEIYQAVIDVIQRDAVLALDEEISAARKRNAKPSVRDKLEAQKLDLRADVYSLPPSLGKEWLTFEGRINAARATLNAEYDRAILGCRSARYVAEARELEAEQERWRSDSVVRLPRRVMRQEVANEPASGNSVAPMPAVPPAPPIDLAVLVDSQWRFTRQSNGLSEPGAFRILNGSIYHLDMLNDPLGEAGLDADGLLHLSFARHRKLVGGEAIVEKINPNEWRGRVLLSDGWWEFEMIRR